MTLLRPASERSDRSGPRRIGLIGGTQFSLPLDRSTAKKFETLAPLGTFWVIGFGPSMWPRRAVVRGVTFYLLPGRWWPIARYLLLFIAGTLLCAWCVVAHGVRIFVAQSPYEAAPAALVTRLARLVGRRVVLIVESHGNFQTSLFLQRAVRFRGVYQRAMRAAASYGASAADLLRAVSNATGQQLRALAGPRPLVTFHTWTDLDVFFAAGAARRPGTAIVYAGVLTPLKGLHVLIDAFAAVDGAGVDLFIIGRPVNPTYAAEQRRRVDAAGLHTRVHFVDHVAQAELARRLAEARAFVLPSFSEGLPRVVLEAMAAGAPVVATHLPGVAELVEDGVTGWLIPPGDVVVLAARLRWLLAHLVEAEAVGGRAREFARQRYSVAAYRRGYERLFEAADELLGIVPVAATLSRGGRGQEKSG